MSYIWRDVVFLWVKMAKGIRAGKSRSGVHPFDIYHLQFLPQFNRTQNEISFFFLLWVAKARNWPDVDCTLKPADDMMTCMICLLWNSLKCVLPGQMMTYINYCGWCCCVSGSVSNGFGWRGNNSATVSLDWWIIGKPVWLTLQDVVTLTTVKAASTVTRKRPSNG